MTPSSQGLLFPLPKNELESVGMYEDDDVFLDRGQLIRM